MCSAGLRPAEATLTTGVARATQPITQARHNGREPAQRHAHTGPVISPEQRFTGHTRPLGEGAA